MSSSQHLKRPTISLAIIAKNEEKNLPRLFDSIEGCFDEVVVIDTGSTDKTKAIAQDHGAIVYDFAWINDFAAARNFAFSKTTSDYVMWMDCDDVLSDKVAFIQWRDHAMQFAEVFFNTYHYALDENRKPLISFVRERVFKKSVNPTWRYRLHEGIIVHPSWVRDYAVTWSVHHMRDALDVQADKSRNIKLLEEIKAQNGLDARLQFYYGKELYEAGKANEAILAFRDAVKNESLEYHDRILSYQYAAYSCVTAADQMKDELKDQKNSYYTEAISLCHEGMKLDPNRAEFHVCIGDTYLKMGDLAKAIPYYGAAKKCVNPKDLGSPYEGAIYSFLDCYGQNPTIQLAKIYANIGRLEQAEAEAKEAVEKYKSQEAQHILDEVAKIKMLVTIDNGQEQTEDIVFTTPPMTAYEFDEDIYKEKGLGGSETALVNMAALLKKKTGRSVKIFCMRAEDKVCESGVEYLSNKNICQYFSKYRPRLHVAWRHNIELTKAPTYLWCHDLVTATVESRQNFDKMLCLSKFHKDYVMAKQGVPSEKIVITRNGLVPEKFDFERKPKNPNKLVFMSSPDRGLDRAMFVCDELVKEFPSLELHVYYGLENLYKYGMGQMADRLKALMAERTYVKYHGFTEQSKMYEEVSDAVIWCHPCNFIESFCITALEMLALGVFPVTRRLGALQNTLADAESKGQAILIDEQVISDSDIAAKKGLEPYINACREVLREEKWKSVSLDIEKHSWSEIANEWIAMMNVASIPKLSDQKPETGPLEEFEILTAQDSIEVECQL